MADSTWELRPDADLARDGPAPDSDTLRAEISQTRTRLSETLDELGERLNPQNVKHEITERVKDRIRGATIGRVQQMARHTADRMHDTRTSLMEAVRENPVPASLVGIGLAWLFMNQARNKPSRARRPARYADEFDEERWNEFDEADFDAELPQRATGRVDRLRERTAELTENVKAASGDVVQRAQHAMEDAGDRAREVAGRVRRRARNVAGDVARSTRHQAYRVEDYYEENPLVLGVAALGAGLAVGMSVPRTQTETRLVGEARDEFVEKVRDVVDEKKAKVETVAGRVYEEGKRVAKEAAREEGLTQQ
jgi:ElaB/YqjD/DUF883 family membrane-anchored ribosome-binding protein